MQSSHNHQETGSCHAKTGQKATEHNHHSGNSALTAAAHATLHCLTGCVIGEVIGLMIGVHFGFSPWVTMTLATVLAFITGFALTIFPLMKRTGLAFGAAMSAIWLGETISIGVMEVVMNAVDYHMGGMQAPSVASWQFWQGIMYAIPAGYVAALPVNVWLIGRQLKKCH